MTSDLFYPLNIVYFVCLQGDFLRKSFGIKADLFGVLPGESFTDHFDMHDVLDIREYTAFLTCRVVSLQCLKIAFTCRSSHDSGSILHLFDIVAGRQTYVIDKNGECQLSFNSQFEPEKHIDEVRPLRTPIHAAHPIQCL